MTFTQRVSAVTIAAACSAAPTIAQTALNDSVYQMGTTQLRAEGYSVGTVRQDSLGRLTFYACAGDDGRILILSEDGTVVSDEQVACTGDLRTAARQSVTTPVGPDTGNGRTGDAASDDPMTPPGDGDDMAGGENPGSDGPATDGSSTGADVAAGIDADVGVGVAGSDGGAGLAAEAGASVGTSGADGSSGLGLDADVDAAVGSSDGQSGLDADVDADVSASGSKNGGLGIGLDVSVGLGS
ncbi:MAG: hypothetical protein HOY44_05550 [Maritimibacter sp.]|uniref:hypothetical protein n=1 Tax=Maritimibacter sp. TaxID=2003363 RepID=UPI001D2740BC|nr:hypothetical protein [Maritimibacter sp.]MBL6426971.1 hypothetical protein [Maritimibacter sp.]